MLNITKEFPGIIANDNITLQLKKGEIHALLGENGAGKSTLMSVLFGLYQPEKGEIRKNGETVKIKDPNDANDLGIGMVHQHFKLSPSLTVYENIVLGIETNKKLKIGNKEINLPLIDNKRERKVVEDLIQKYNFSLNPDDKIRDLSIGARQRVEILKMLYRQVKVLILDEPTAVLIPQEVEELIAKIHDLKRMGQTVIIITHKLNEVKACADTISVMRRGQLIDTIVNDDAATTEKLAEMMVGRPVLLRVSKSGKPVGDKPVLEVRHLSAKNAEGREVVRDVSFTIHENEILGVAGIEGNGQTELMYLLTGLMKPTAGSVKLRGKEILNEWPDEL
ncbi:MAG: ATP-binding cassette domain-containing protein, partial [Clostridia bacterium]|nr:ATP-binding cassette domain-containing protein [Clostridia bacterium]